MLTAEQKELRRTGIGGSEIASIVGLNPYAGPLDVWLAKVEGYEIPDNAAMERGRFLEDGVARWYAHRTGAELREVGTIQHPRFPFALCTPDRLATHFKAKEPIDLSIKVPGPYVREQWGEEGTDDVPMPHLLQVQWELAILDALGEVFPRLAHLAAPIDGDLRIYNIKGDPDLQGVLLTEAEKFWLDHVITGKPPPLDGSDSAAAWLSRRFPRNVEPLRSATAEEEALALRLREYEAGLAIAQADFDATKNVLKERIGSASGIEGAFGSIRWTADKNGKRSFKPKWRKS